MHARGALPPHPKVWRPCTCGNSRTESQCCYCITSLGKVIAIYSCNIHYTCEVVASIYNITANTLPMHTSDIFAVISMNISYVWEHQTARAHRASGLWGLDSTARRKYSPEPDTSFFCSHRNSAYDRSVSTEWGLQETACEHLKNSQPCRTR